MLAVSNKMSILKQIWDKLRWMSCRRYSHEWPFRSHFTYKLRWTINNYCSECMMFLKAQRNCTHKQEFSIYYGSECSTFMSSIFSIRAWHLEFLPGKIVRFILSGFKIFSSKGESFFISSESLERLFSRLPWAPSMCRWNWKSCIDVGCNMLFYLFRHQPLCCVIVCVRLDFYCWNEEWNVKLKSFCFEGKAAHCVTFP